MDKQNKTENFTIKKLYDICEGKSFLEETLINYLNIKNGKTGKYPYNINDFYIDDNTFCIVYTDNNNMESDVGDMYCEVEKEDFDELIDILNNPEKDIYYYLRSKV